MKDLLKLAVLQLVSAVVVYLLLFLVGGLWSFIGWLIVLTAIMFILNRKRKIRYPWWLEKMRRKLWSILPRFDGR